MLTKERGPSSKSVSIAALPFWEAVYREAFPGLSAIRTEPEESLDQRRGVDRTIMRDGRPIRVKEVVRGHNRFNGTTHADIALEYNANTLIDAPGWACKPILADYIAYAIPALARCYLLPVESLQRAWEVFGPGWMTIYPRIRTYNPQYETLSVAVPPTVLFSAMERYAVDRHEAKDIQLRSV